LADKTEQLVVEGLSRAMAEPGGICLHGSKTSPGLFATTGPAKQAAQQCKEAGFLKILRTETKGKTVQEICAITENGIAYLLSQVSPKQVLENLVQAVESRGEQVGELVEAARVCQNTFATLKAQVEKVIGQIGHPAPATASTSVNGNGPGPWKTEVLAYLRKWQSSRTNEDCPLPDLYEQARRSAANLTLGQFHDGLRALHDQGQIYLHPWTGPLYEIPQPSFALLIGHAVAYYASKK
jgi:hypothetical protein